MVLQIKPEMDIQLFDDRSACIQNILDKSFVQKIKDCVQAFLNLMFFKGDSIFASSELEVFTEMGDEALSKKRLIVCIHGLCGSPYEFKILVDKLKTKNLSDTAIFIPYVQSAGKDRLDSMANEIFKEIQAWAAGAGEEKELILIGVSNGARISRKIETQITGTSRGKVKELRVVSVVGARQGSPLVNLARQFGFSWAVSWFISQPIVEEMPMNSERNQQLDKEWNLWIQNDVNDLECDFTFIASPFDAHIGNYDSSLPVVPDNIKARYGIVSDHGHFTAIDGAASTIADLLFEKTYLN